MATASRISGVVVSHGHARELEASLPALTPQVDELVVVANLPNSLPADLHGARVIENERPRSYAANLNAAVARTAGELIAVCNPDAVPAPDAVRILADFMQRTPRCGIAGPQMFDPEGEWQPSRRRFPTVMGTVVRRTPLRRAFPPLERQRTTTCSTNDRPSRRDRLDAGRFLLLRRTMLDEIGGYDAGFRMYGEEIDLSYRAAKAGWERWYVPGAVVRHRWDRLTDERFLTRRTLWHWRGMFRFVRKHPERLRSL